MDAVLHELVARDAPSDLSLEPNADPGFAGIPAQEVDAALREALGRGLLDGERATFSGPEVLWSNPRLRVAGLRHLGEWPPAGGEHLPGPWDHRYWGQRALPALRDVRENPPYHGFLFGPYGGMDDEGWSTWCAILRLLDIGLIDGDLEQGGLSDVRVTAAGAQVLDPVDRDPLAVAAVAFRHGNKADATIAAVEEALGGRLKELAAVHRVSLVDARGGAKKLSVLNNDLKTAGAFDEAERTQVDAWLKLRNGVGHGRGEAVSLGRIETLLSGVRVFLEDHRA